MKKIIFMLLLAACGFVCNASNDSLINYEPDDVDKLLSLAYFEEVPAIESMKQRAGFFDKLLNSFTKTFRPVWGTYDEQDHRAEGPYTVFQHHRQPLPMQLVTIRNKLLNKTDKAYFLLYANIYKAAIEGPTADCRNGETNVTCSSPKTAKCAAFVYLVGIQFIDITPSSGGPNLPTMLDSMAFIPDPATRKALFADKAMNIVHCCPVYNGKCADG